MWLPWQWALAVAAVLTLVTATGRRSTGRWAQTATPITAEATRVFLLYALWQLAGRIAVLRVDDAVARGEKIWSFQRAVLLPDEAALQRLVLPVETFVKSMNIYYATAHVGGMIVCLLWMFMSRRHAYVAFRRALVFITAISLVIQLVPVAPPRLVPATGMIDVAQLYGQSVYPRLGSPGPAQLSAMPSLHVGWAALVALATFTLLRSRWRWVGPAHLVLTMLVVAATANHYWLDGIVDVALLGAWFVLPGNRLRLNSHEDNGQTVQEGAYSRT